MELIYAALLLHKAGQKINEANIKRVVEAANIKADDSKIKSLVAALGDVDIEKVIKESAQIAAPVETKKEEKREEKKEEAKDEKKEAKAAAGLASLFG